MIKWNEFVSWLFFALLSYFAYDMSNTTKNMSTSINELNKNVAVVVYQVSNQEKIINEHGQRLRDLETGKND